MPDVHLPPPPTAAVLAVLQGYGGRQQPVTDASAELHRLCGCLELLLQVPPSLRSSHSPLSMPREPPDTQPPQSQQALPDI